jgi:hypothetical protein
LPALRGRQLGDAHALPYLDASYALEQQALTPDAKIAAELLGNVFARVEVERWDAPILTLPSTDSIRDYLLGKRPQCRACPHAGR